MLGAERSFAEKLKLRYELLGFAGRVSDHSTVCQRRIASSVNWFS